MASPGLTQQQFADRAGTSQQAVSKALARGHLVRRADGRLDPKHENNAGWIERHKQGSDDRGRWLGSHLGPGRRNARSPEAGHDEADLSDDDWVRRILAENSSDDRILAAIEGLKREIVELRRELRDQPRALGGHELPHALADLKLSMGVLLHQVNLKLDGKPLTVAADAFADKSALKR